MCVVVYGRGGRGADGKLSEKWRIASKSETYWSPAQLYHTVQGMNVKKARDFAWYR